MLGCASMTGDTVECFNCGRTNPSWAQVCRSCGVPMRPGGAGARPPSGPLPTDRDSLVSIGAGLATIALAIVFGLIRPALRAAAADKDQKGNNLDAVVGDNESLPNLDGKLNAGGYVRAICAAH